MNISQKFLLIPVMNILEKSRKNTRLVPKTVILTNDTGTAYQKTVWVLPSKAKDERPSGGQFDMFEDKPEPERNPGQFDMFDENTLPQPKEAASISTKEPRLGIPNQKEPELPKESDGGPKAVRVRMTVEEYSLEIKPGIKTTVDSVMLDGKPIGAVTEWWVGVGKGKKFGISPLKPKKRKPWEGPDEIIPPCETVEEALEKFAMKVYGDEMAEKAKKAESAERSKKIRDAKNQAAIATAKPATRVEATKILADDDTEPVAKSEEPYMFTPSMVTLDFDEPLVVHDYSAAIPARMSLIDQKKIKSAPRPSWIPPVDQESFKSMEYRIEGVKLGQDKYLIITKDKLVRSAGRNPPTIEREYALVNLSVLAATQDYCYKLAKSINEEKNTTLKELGIKGNSFRQIASTKATYRHLDLIKIAFPFIPRNGRQKWEKFTAYINDLKEKTIDMTLQTEEDMNSYAKGRETSYGRKGTVDGLLASHGVVVKRQNGDDISSVEVDELKKALSAVYKVFGDRSALARRTKLLISHSGEKFMHARKALGLYLPAWTAIGVTWSSGQTGAGFTLAHEFSHFMDHQLGKLGGENYYASDDRSSLEYRIAKTFRSNMKKEQNSDYQNRTCECFARALEQYYAIKSGEADEYASERNAEGNHPEHSVYMEKVYPLVEQFLTEHGELLKSLVGSIVDQKPSGKLKLLTISDLRMDAKRFIARIEEKYPDELAAGIEVEKEHSDDIDTARAIAAAHIDQDPNYYSKLNTVGLVDEPKAKRLIVPLSKALNTGKLIKKQVMVVRDGKSFASHRWTKPDDIDSETKKAIRKIKMARAGDPKERLYLAYPRSERDKLVEAMVLSLPEGARPLSRIMDEIQENYGVFAGMDVSEKMILGLSSRYPHRVDCSFTLGLQEVYIKGISKSLTWSGYKLQGRTKIHGMDISIENKKGSVRRGVDPDGHAWETKMHFTYGYIRGTVGKDKDHLDCYIGPNPDSRKVFIVHQNDPKTGKYDEDKTMLGFDSGDKAKRAYLGQYDRPGFFGSMDETDVDTFKTKAFKNSCKGKKLIVR